jgi:hypothetical protein
VDGLQGFQLLQVQRVDLLHLNSANTWNTILHLPERFHSMEKYLFLF